MIHPRWLIVAPIVALTAALGVARSPAVEISGVVFEDTNRCEIAIADTAISPG